MIRQFTRAEVERALSLMRQLGQHNELMDCHVHCTEVFNPEPVPSGDRIANDEPLSNPTAFRELSSEQSVEMSAAKRNQISRVLLETAYSTRTAERLALQMSQAGFRRALALPVWHPDGDIERQMEVLRGFQPAIPGLMLACSVPFLAADRVKDFVGSMQVQRGIRAVKLHLNISRINLDDPTGREFVEANIQACADLKLTLVFHGGRSPLLAPDPSASYATIERIASLDLRGPPAVVIAHCGVYGLADHEIADALKIIRKITATHEHIYFNTAGLSSAVLSRVLRSIGIERILFGSDALYVPIWRALTSHLHALAEAGFASERSFLFSAGTLPTRVFGNHPPS